MQPIDFALAVAAAAFALTVVQIVRGPSDADRAVASDVGFYAFMTVAAIVGIRMPGTSFLTLMLVAAVVGLLSSLSWARLIDREEER